MRGEVCPSCGDLVDRLHEYTGFCDSCTGSLGIPTRNGAFKLTPEMEAMVQELRGEGMKRRDAIAQIYSDRRPICAICKNPIKGGQPGRALICTKTPTCKKARNRYWYLKYYKNLSRDEALEKVKEQYAHRV